jgi:hypothetical protein
VALNPSVAAKQYAPPQATAAASEATRSLATSRP